MAAIFDCVQCVRTVTLTKSGRCPWCGSDAIAPATETNWQWKTVRDLRAEQAEIEHLYTMLAKPDPR